MWIFYFFFECEARLNKIACQLFFILSIRFLLFVCLVKIIGEELFHFLSPVIFFGKIILLVLYQSNDPHKSPPQKTMIHIHFAQQIIFCKNKIKLLLKISPAVKNATPISIVTFCKQGKNVQSCYLARYIRLVNIYNILKWNVNLEILIRASTDIYCDSISLKLTDKID